MATELATGYISLAVSTKGMGKQIARGFQGAERQADSVGQKAGGRFSGSFGKALKVGALGAAVAGAVAVKGLSSSIKAAGDLEQSVGGVRAVFKGYAKDIERESKAAAKSVGLSENAYNTLATTLGAMLKNKGIKDFAGQTQNLIGLGADMAAQFGGSSKDAVEAIGAAMRGESDPIERYGVSLNETAVNAVLAAKGQDKLKGAALDQAKAQARLTILFKQTKDAQGAFGRESDTLAGKQQRAGAQWENLKAKIGGSFLPAASAAMGFVSNKMIPGLDKLADLVADLGPTFGSIKNVVSTTFSAFSDALGGGQMSFKRFADFLETHQADIVGGFVTAGKAVIAFASGLSTGLSVGLRAFGAISDGVGHFVAFSIDQFGLMLAAAELSMGWMPGIGPKLKEASAKFGVFATNARANIYDTGNAARGLADGIDKNLKPALDSAGRSLDKVGAKEIIKAKTRDAVKRAAIAIRDLGTTSDGSQIKLKTFADRSKLSAVEQYGLRVRLKEASSGLRNQIRAMQDAKAGQGKLSKAWEVGKDRLYKEFRQMGLSRAEAKKLAAQYAGIKPKVETKVTQPGMKGARSETRGLDKDINDLNNKSIAIKVKYSAAGKITVGSIKDRKLSGPGGALGGVLPGFTPGRDVHHFTSPTAGNLHLSGGEAIMRPEWTRAVGGAPAVARMNSAARRGQRFVSGGLYRTIALQGSSNNAPDVAGRYASAVGAAGSRAESLARAAAKKVAAAEVARQKAAIKKARAAASGGPVSGGGFAKALSYARRNEGHPYIFGSMWDCSGFISALHNIILGKGPGGRRYSTPAFHGAHAQGFTRGKRSPFMVGVNPAPGRFGHMAGTLNGVNVESRGGDGVVVGGGARGWNNGLFSWRGGLANGGVIGDLPFDLLDPKGQRYDPALAAMLFDRAAAKFDRGGYLKPGLTIANNQTSQREKILDPAQTKAWENGQNGGVHFHAPVTVADPDELIKKIDRRERRKQTLQPVMI